MDATNKCLGGKADTIKVLQSQIKRLELHSRALAENHSTLEAVINSTGLGIGMFKRGKLSSMNAGRILLAIHWKSCLL